MEKSPEKPFEIHLYKMGKSLKEEKKEDDSKQGLGTQSMKSKRNYLANIQW